MIALDVSLLVGDRVDAASQQVAHVECPLEVVFDLDMVVANRVASSAVCRIFVPQADQIDCSSVPLEVPGSPDSGMALLPFALDL